MNLSIRPAAYYTVSGELSGLPLRVRGFGLIFAAKKQRPLEEGAKVVSAEGDQVGEVERVYAEEAEQRVTHILISKGLVSKTRKLIPTMWVEHVAEDEVRLSISKNFVDDLPEFSVQD